MPQSLLVKEKASQSPGVEEGLQNIMRNHAIMNYMARTVFDKIIALLEKTACALL